MKQISPARKAAFAILLAVERGRGHSDDLLRAQAVAALTEPDRGLATALVLGVLRWQIALDELVRPLLKRPGAKLDLEVRVALRLGAYQLLHMDRIPARAAIDESVELAKAAGHRFASTMINAVLRRLAEEARTDPDSAQELSAHPAWMADRWRRFFGADCACAICAHDQKQPTLSVRFERPETEQELAAEGVELAPGRLLRSARVVLSGNVSETEAFRAGRVRIQDEGSQLVAEIAGHGSSILDCCAAPGGKTLVLAERNAQAHIVACEASPARLEALRHRLAPLGERVECRLADATALDSQAEFDLVLADVPCSGTGTLGRNPEIRHQLALEDLERQATRQRAILIAALNTVRSGGRVVYSTCSLEPEENEQVVERVLHESPHACIVPIQARIDEMDREGILMPGAADALKTGTTAEGYLRLFPGTFGTDGFFVAVLGKPAEPAHHSGGSLSSA
ncbi:MAG TPA: transcription antitermination factor NusB [Terracidiphilus sp.]|jgi:16S rRNA (cytosine967-C5)-methyltransferase|nr:transcription antitermination factor NusB [Terracidiphilus sp.]